MSFKTIEEVGAIKIIVTGRLSFGEIAMFQQTYQELDKTVPKYILDFRALEFMDSTALGALIQLNEWLGNTPGKVEVLVSEGMVHDTLKIAHFDKIFSVQLDCLESDG